MYIIITVNKEILQVYPSINTPLGPHSSLPPAQPTQGANCSEDAHIRIPHPPNPWILRCGMGPPHSPRRKQLEMVQRRYACDTSRDYGRTSSVTAILETLGWEPLAERRAKARITMMYRIVHGIVDILSSDHMIQAHASRRTGNAQFRVPYARTLAYQRGFTRLWTPSQMMLQKQRASTSLRKRSPMFASDVESTPAPCK